MLFKARFASIASPGTVPGSSGGTRPQSSEPELHLLQSSVNQERGGQNGSCERRFCTDVGHRNHKARWTRSNLSGRYPDSDAGALDLRPPARYKRAAGLLSLNLDRVIIVASCLEKQANPSHGRHLCTHRSGQPVRLR